MSQSIELRFFNTIFTTYCKNMAPFTSLQVAVEALRLLNCTSFLKQEFCRHIGKPDSQRKICFAFKGTYKYPSWERTGEFLLPGVKICLEVCLPVVVTVMKPCKAFLSPA